MARSTQGSGDRLARLCSVDLGLGQLPLCILKAAFMTYASLNGLSPTNFENLCFDIVRGLAFQNPTWRTPGVDGGRDIEAWRATVDPTFASNQEKWFIECKRYKAAVDWPTIHEKIAHAEALDADYLFLMTTSSASPTSIDRINAWNALNKRPRVRFWSGHDISAHIEIRKELSLKYGLGGTSADTFGFAGVSLEMSKIISTIHSLSQFNRETKTALEYANALARCWTERVSQLQSHGAFFPFAKNIATDDFAEFLSTSDPCRDLGRGELLTILWVSFVTEKRPLCLNISNEKISLSLTVNEAELVMSTPSNKAIAFIAGSELSQNNGELVIREMKYD